MSAPPAPLEVFDTPLATVPSDTLATASWRTFRPVIDRAKCTRCNLCWKFCPDVALELDAQGFPALRESFCKGCGICAEECPPKAIVMEKEV